jgi:undecaprenyl diphosphate synthase
MSLTGETTDLLPKHIAIIMDGNGRWAQRRGLPRIEGHRRGVQSVRETVESCAEIGIEQLTLYCLSSENWKRPESELRRLMNLLEQFLIEERSLIMRQNLRFATIGRREGLSDGVIRQIDRTLEATQNNVGMRLCLALNYGSRGEITDATKLIAQRVAAGELDPAEITEETIADHLYTAGMPDPDLLIRTAGEMRLSNYLLWQVSYAELWVTDLCWPEFRRPVLEEAIQAFANRDRRYGGLKN